MPYKDKVILFLGLRIFLTEISIGLWQNKSKNNLNLLPIRTFFSYFSSKINNTKRITLFDNFNTVYIVHSITFNIFIKGAWWIFALFSLYLTQNIYLKMVKSFLYGNPNSHNGAVGKSVGLGWRKLGVRIPAHTDLIYKNR